MPAPQSKYSVRSWPVPRGSSVRLDTCVAVVAPRQGYEQRCEQRPANWQRQQRDKGFDGIVRQTSAGLQMVLV